MTTKKEDGYRILIDRLWPRGVKKEDAKIDQWLKDSAPSSELRKWFHEDKDRYSDFKEKYLEELETQGEAKEAVMTILEKLEIDDVSLIYSAKSRKNHAVILQEHINKKAERN